MNIVTGGDDDGHQNCGRDSRGFRKALQAHSRQVARQLPWTEEIGVASPAFSGALVLEHF